MLSSYSVWAALAVGWVLLTVVFVPCAGAVVVLGGVGLLDLFSENEFFQSHYTALPRFFVSGGVPRKVMIFLPRFHLHQAMRNRERLSSPRPMRAKPAVGTTKTKVITIFVVRAKGSSRKQRNRVGIARMAASTVLRMGNRPNSRPASV